MEGEGVSVLLWSGLVALVSALLSGALLSSLHALTSAQKEAASRTANRARTAALGETAKRLLADRTRCADLADISGLSRYRWRPARRTLTPAQLRRSITTYLCKIYERLVISCTCASLRSSCNICRTGVVLTDCGFCGWYLQRLLIAAFSAADASRCSDCPH